MPKLDAQTLQKRSPDEFINPSAQNDVTGSRTLGSTYQNTTRKPIFVVVSSQSTSTAGDYIAYCDSSATPTTIVCQSKESQAAYDTPLFFIVLPDYYYKVTVTATATLTAWIEWS